MISVSQTGSSPQPSDDRDTSGLLSYQDSDGRLVASSTDMCDQNEREYILIMIDEIYDFRNVTA